MKRAIILLGAGASVEYGAPSTTGITNEIEQAALADDWVRHVGGDAAFKTIKEKLVSYLQKPGVVNFEQIYHCAHELIFTFPPTERAVDEFRPVLFPFLEKTVTVSETALRVLCEEIVDTVYNGDPPRVKLDLTADEILVMPAIVRPVTHPYSDAPEDGIEARCYAFEEVFGEKVRALGERSRPRDLYDVINLFRNGDFPAAASAIRRVVTKKCTFNAHFLAAISANRTIP